MLAGRDSSSSVGFYTRFVSYDNGFVDVLCAEAPVFRRPGWEVPFGDDEARLKTRTRKVEAGKKAGDLKRAVRRARANVRKIALANDFDFFVTLTQNPEKVDRYDSSQCIRKLCKWCENQVQRYGLRYVVIPERHKDGAIHYHGFMSWDGEAGAGVVESGTFSMDGWNKPRKAVSRAQADEWRNNGARVVFNIPRWRLGFSTAMDVYGKYDAAVGYVCKYIGKQMDGARIGGRWFYHGGKLRKPRVDLCNLMWRDFDNIPGTFDFTVGPVGRMRMWRGEAARLAEMLGPVLENQANNDFLDRFYSIDDDYSVSCETFDDDFAFPEFDLLPDDTFVPFL